jgi:hypothetical protein
MECIPDLDGVGRVAAAPVAGCVVGNPAAAAVRGVRFVRAEFDCGTTAFDDFAGICACGAAKSGADRVAWTAGFWTAASGIDNRKPLNGFSSAAGVAVESSAGATGVATAGAVTAGGLITGVGAGITPRG